MNKLPFISIAMATYNGEKFIQAQLDSIINQTHKNIEIVICDDGSCDKTIDIIKKYKKKYSFIKLFENKKNLGYAKNFEKAISLCEYDYIALCDQDDIWQDNKLEVQLKYLLQEEKAQKEEKQNKAILVHSDLIMIDDETKIFNNSYFKYRKYKLKKQKDLGHILGPCGVMGNTLLFNKKLKEKILPFPPYVENHDYWIALICEIFGKRITLDEKLVKYRIHTSNASNCANKIKVKKKKLNLIKTILSRDFYVPYLNTKRFQLISYLLRNYDLPKSDKIVLMKFQEYLSKQTSTFKKLINVLKYSFYKRDLLYRIVFLNALFIRKDISKRNFYIYNIFQIFTNRNFEGWGRKNSGLFAKFCNKIFKGKLRLLEDGFIRSIDLNKSLIKSLSCIKDDVGIYYDATKASKLENILNTYDFKSDKKLMKKAKQAISLIIENNISKYNHPKNIEDKYFKKDEKKVLVISQVENDKSLEYGLTNNTSLYDLINLALEENKDSIVYIKVHPDYIIRDNFNFSINNSRCKIIKEEINSISLLKHFEKVYTRTSLMGFEALLLGKKCICLGMPFYASWGLTEDRLGKNERRKRQLSIEELFAASYILYTEYSNPYSNEKIDIIEAINYIIEYKQNEVIT